MRETGPIRLKLEGDGAASYVARARTELGIMKNLMRFNGLTIATRSFALPNGVLLQLQSVAGQDYVRIVMPAVPAVPAVAEPVKEIKQEVPSRIRVGGSYIGGGIQAPFIWSQEDGFISIPLTDADAVMTAFSADGFVLGGRISYTDHDALALIDIRALTAPVVSLLPFGNTEFGGELLALTRNGQRGVGEYYDATNTTEAVFDLVSGTTFSLPSPVDGFNSLTSISSDGRYAAGVSYHDTLEHPLLWDTQTGATELPMADGALSRGRTLGVAVSGSAAGVSTGARVVVGYGVYRVRVTEQTQIEDLLTEASIYPTLPGYDRPYYVDNDNGKFWWGRYDEFRFGSSYVENEITGAWIFDHNYDLPSNWYYQPPLNTPPTLVHIDNPHPFVAPTASAFIESFGWGAERDPIYRVSSVEAEVMERNYYSIWDAHSFDLHTVQVVGTWTDRSTFTPLSPSPSPVSIECPIEYAIGISDDEAVILGRFLDTTGYYVGFVWTEGSVVNLTIPAEYVECIPTHLSNDGESVVARIMTSSHVTHLAVWLNSQWSTPIVIIEAGTDFSVAGVSSALV